ncbi:MAG: formylmethanofuran dehydrogenase subunit C [Geminicoccaceae bacterium]|nr:formylmethanofuran dehydrogenase subunit C [Geminicoccaceae bacterium]MDW8341694.1 formylmethanofuran dehydrogenase subunit C [Geminicoccaceae bacterium]MDW8444061.1 formylmethanofuran dehydrogenase subunit C [Acetobacteraceae bacterium]
MTARILRLREPPALPLDLSPLLPETVLGRSEREIAAIPLRLGNRSVRSGDLFAVRTAPEDTDTLVLEGTSRTCDRIGAGLRAGTLRVVGDAGVELGLGMSGGRIEVEGSVGALAAAQATGGFVRVRGAAGARLAGALPGSGGTAGATVVVEGRCGPMAGEAMRRGLLILLGGCDEHLGFGLRGGTVILRGACGPGPGAAMRRGSLLLLDGTADPGPSFADAGTHDLLWLALVQRQLRLLGLGDLLPGRRVRRLLGDLADLGKGELLLFS